jgi:hypothetical protein
VPWRTTQEFTGACLLEAFCDGFACFLHEKFGKGEENIAFRAACKEESVKILKWLRVITQLFTPGQAFNTCSRSANFSAALKLK